MYNIKIVHVDISWETHTVCSREYRKIGLNEVQRLYVIHIC